MYKKIIKFGLVGASGAVIGLAIITLTVEVFKINPRQAWYISSFFATLSNFFLNNYYTWAERRAIAAIDVSKKIIFYYAFSILSIIVNFIIYNFLLKKGWHYYFALGMAIAICALINFLLNELVVWRKVRKLGN